MFVLKYLAFVRDIFISNLREINDDILNDWLMFREDELASLKCDEDKKHFIYFDEISERILKNVS